MNRGKRVVLIVEDSPSDRELLRAFLERDSSVQYQFIETEMGKSVSGLCQEHLPDCVLLDYRLPDMDGLDVLNELRRSRVPVPPVVFLTAQGDEYLAVQAMKGGASDYLAKARLTPDFLQTAVKEAILRSQDTGDTHPSRMDTATVVPRVVDRRYALESEGLRGGMGTVFEARDMETGDKVALKMLRRPSETIRRRFQREIRVLANLRHPAIVRYLNHGTTDDGDVYLVMAWLDGVDLGDYLETDSLSPAQTVRLGVGVSEALEAAHSQGLIHRDIKPSNLFLPDRDVNRIKVIDFGVVHDANSGTFLTATGLAVGTPGYMAPEQVLDDTEADHRADIFALGCVMFRCLTGRHYFSGRNVVAVMAKLTDDDYDARARLYELDIPVAFAELLGSMLSRRPEERPSRALEVAERLRALPPFEDP